MTIDLTHPKKSFTIPNCSFKYANFTITAKLTTNKTNTSNSRLFQI